MEINNKEKRSKYIRQDPNIGREFKDKQIRIVSSLNDDGIIDMSKIEYVTECMVCHYPFIFIDEKTGKRRGRTLYDINRLSNYKSCNGVCSHKEDPIMRAALGEVINNKWKISGVYPEKNVKGQPLFRTTCLTCGHQSIHSLDTLKDSNKNTLCKHEFWLNDQIKNIYFMMVKSGKISRKWYDKSIKNSDNLGYVFQEWLIYKTDYLKNPNGKLVLININKEYSEDNCNWVVNIKKEQIKTYKIPECNDNNFFNLNNNNCKYAIHVNGYLYSPYDWDIVLSCTLGTIDNYFKINGLQKTAEYILELFTKKYYPNLITPIIRYYMVYY